MNPLLRSTTVAGTKIRQKFLPLHLTKLYYIHSVLDSKTTMRHYNGVGEGGGPRWRGYMYTYSWFMQLYSRNEHNIVKQLYSNKNNQTNKCGDEFHKSGWAASPIQGKHDYHLWFVLVILITIWSLITLLKSSKYQII